MANLNWLRQGAWAAPVPPMQTSGSTPGAGRSGPADASGQAAATAGRRALMRPVVAGDCFGWLHTAGEAAGGEVAVLICPGLNRDQLDAHHSLRMLADELAGAGYPAMRLDYPGLGDSADLAAPAEPWTGWQQALHAALDWLRAATGARQVVLCGLRIGATLATLVAERRDDVAALLLLAPVLRGRSYIQQLQMQARLEGQAAASRDGGLEFYELCFGADTVERISAVDLRRARLPSGLRVAMFEQSASKLGEDCAGVWGALGVGVVRAGFDGLDPLLRHNEEVEGTPADFSSLLAWLREAAPARPTALAGASWSAPSLARPGWVETPRRFGPGDGLFGMLCRPDRRIGDTAVIIVNTGRDPHYGASRFGVEFARHLAGLGVTSLRIDFAGLGDSVGPPGKESVLTSMFGFDRTPDIAAAADLLTRLGYRRIAINGNCSGAYHALRGALADPRIATALLLNLPVFEWHPDATVDFMHRRNAKPSRYLLRLGSKDAWRRLLRGSLDIGEVLRAQGARLYARMRQAGLRLAERCGWIGAQGVGRRAMASLARRGAHTLLLFSANEEGLDVMEQEFGRNAKGLLAFDGAKMRVVPELDHLLSTPAMRQTAMQILARFLLDSPAAAEAVAAGSKPES